MALHRRWTARALVVAALLLAAAAPPAAAWPRGGFRVHDGDTFSVGARRIRIRGIDAPERGQPGAAAAARRLAELLRHRPVVIVPVGRDVYGRLLADVYVGGRRVADLLRQEGFGKPAR